LYKSAWFIIDRNLIILLTMSKTSAIDDKNKKMRIRQFFLVVQHHQLPYKVIYVDEQLKINDQYIQILISSFHLQFLVVDELLDVYMDELFH